MVVLEEGDTYAEDGKKMRGSRATMGPTLLQKKRKILHTVFTLSAMIYYANR